MECAVNLDDCLGHLRSRFLDNEYKSPHFDKGGALPQTFPLLPFVVSSHSPPSPTELFFFVYP